MQFGTWKFMTLLAHDSKAQNEGSNRLNDIHQHIEVFAVADRKTRHVKIP